jgi:hypothetical protein
MQNSEISFSQFATAKGTSPVTVTLAEVLDLVRNNRDLAITTAKLRAALARSPGEYADAKKELTCVTFGAVHTDGRNHTTVTARSGLMVIDIDKLGKLGKDAAALRDLAGQEPYTVAAFVSPSGDGVKIIVKIGTDYRSKNEQARLYGHAARYFSERFGVPYDGTSKDIYTRLCFLCSDENVIENEIETVATFEAPDLTSEVFDTGHDTPGVERASVAPEAPPLSTPAPLANASDALRHIRNLLAEAGRAKLLDQNASRHSYMLSATVKVWRYILGGHLTEHDGETLANDYADLFTPAERATRLADWRRAFNSEGTKARAFELGPLHPDAPSQTPASAHQATSSHQEPEPTAERLASLLGSIYFPDWHNEPPPRPSALNLNGSRIAQRGELSVFVAAASVGKSAVSGAIWGAAVGKPGRDYLGFEAQLAPGERVLYIDTEQGHDTSWLCWSRAMRRAGYERGEGLDEVEGTYVNLRGIGDVRERLAAVCELVNIGCLGLCIVDGIGDLTKDTNDLAEAMHVVGILQTAAVRNGTAIVTTIHPNFKASGGLEKLPRGHLGSELMRKAVAALSIEKFAGDPAVRSITIPTSFKNRLDYDQITSFFRWSDELKMHVACNVDDLAVAKANAKERAKLAALFEKILRPLNGRGIRHGELAELVAAEKGTEKRQGERLVEKAIKANVITADKIGLGLYLLAEE